MTRAETKSQNNPTMNVKMLRQLRSLALDAIENHALPRVRQSTVFINEKADEETFDLVTNVDVEIQNTLADIILPASETIIRTAYEGIDVTFEGEEGFQRIDTPENKAIWLLDPIDGTLNFALSLPGFSVSLALIINAETVLAIVVDAQTNEVFEAINGCGAFANGRRMHFNEDKFGHLPVCVSSGTLRFAIENKAQAFLEEMAGVSGRFRLIGSQALHLCWVADGRIGLNINREAKIWDDLAGALIARESGAYYTRLSGHNLFSISLDDPALDGSSIFSLCGPRNLVERAVNMLKTQANS